MDKQLGYCERTANRRHQPLHFKLKSCKGWWEWKESPGIEGTDPDLAQAMGEGLVPNR